MRKLILFAIILPILALCGQSANAKNPTKTNGYMVWDGDTLLVDHVFKATTADEKEKTYFEVFFTNRPEVSLWLEMSDYSPSRKAQKAQYTMVQPGEIDRRREDAEVVVNKQKDAYNISFSSSYFYLNTIDKNFNGPKPGVRGEKHQLELNYNGPVEDCNEIAGKGQLVMAGETYRFGYTRAGFDYNYNVLFGASDKGPKYALLNIEMSEELAPGTYQFGGANAGQAIVFSALGEGAPKRVEAEKATMTVVKTEAGFNVDIVGELNGEKFHFSFEGRINREYLVNRTAANYWAPRSANN